MKPNRKQRRQAAARLKTALVLRATNGRCNTLRELIGKTVEVHCLPHNNPKLYSLASEFHLITQVVAVTESKDVHLAVNPEVNTDEGTGQFECLQLKDEPGCEWQLAVKLDKYGTHRGYAARVEFA